jgi:hypothetical protein
MLLSLLLLSLFPYISVYVYSQSSSYQAAEINRIPIPGSPLAVVNNTLFYVTPEGYLYAMDMVSRSTAIIGDVRGVIGGSDIIKQIRSRLFTTFITPSGLVLVDTNRYPYLVFSLAIDNATGASLSNSGAAIWSSGKLVTATIPGLFVRSMYSAYDIILKIDPSTLANTLRLNATDVVVSAALRDCGNCRIVSINNLTIRYPIARDHSELSRLISARFVSGYSTIDNIYERTLAAIAVNATLLISASITMVNATGATISTSIETSAVASGALLTDTSGATYESYYQAYSSVMYSMDRAFYVARYWDDSMWYAIFIDSDGIHRTRIPVDQPPISAFPAGDYVVISTDQISIILSKNYRVIFSRQPGNVAFADTYGSDIVIGYRTPPGTYEIASISPAEGYKVKTILSGFLKPVGILIRGSLIYVPFVSIATNYLIIYTTLPTSYATITFIDNTEGLSTPYWNITVSLDGESYSVSGVGLVARFRAPLGSDIFISVYNEFCQSYYSVKLTSFDPIYLSICQIPPRNLVRGETYQGPAAIQIIDESYVAYKVFPQAVFLEAYGYILYMITVREDRVFAEAYNTVTNESLFSTPLPGSPLSARLAPPYFIVSTTAGNYVLDMSNGYVIYSLPPGSLMFDLSIPAFAVWANNSFTVYSKTARFSASLPNAVSCIVFTSSVARVFSGGLVYLYDALSGTSMGVQQSSIRNISTCIGDGYVTLISFTSGDRFFTFAYRSSGESFFVGNGIAVDVREYGAIPPPNTAARGSFFDIALLSNMPQGIMIYVLGSETSMVGSAAGASTTRGIDFSTRDGLLAYRYSLKGSASTHYIDVIRVDGVLIATLVLREQPRAIAISSKILAYSVANETRVIMDYLSAKRYVVRIDVKGARGEPAPGIMINFGSLKINGSNATIYITSAGDYQLRVSAPYHQEFIDTVKVTSDMNITVNLSPILYRVDLYAVDDRERPVNAMYTIYYRGEPIASGSLANGYGYADLPYGIYNVSMSLAGYINYSTVINVPVNASVRAVMPKILALLSIQVVIDTGSPIANATVSVRYRDTMTTLYTNSSGVVETMIPLGVNASIRASARGYVDSSANVSITDDQLVRIALRTFVGVIIVSVTRDGNPIRASVEVVDQLGNKIYSAIVDGQASIRAGIGVYRITATSMDGVSSTATAAISERSPTASISIELPPPPQPIYVQYAWAIVAAIAAAAAYVTYRRLRGKKILKIR